MLRCGTLKLSWKKSGSHSRENDTMPGKQPFAKVKLVSQEWKAADTAGKIST